MLIDVLTLAKAIRHCSRYANSCKGCTYEEKCKKSKGTNIALRDAAIVLATFGKDFVYDGDAGTKNKKTHE
jgi:hypothetical protein